MDRDCGCTRTRSRSLILFYRTIRARTMIQMHARTNDNNNGERWKNECAATRIEPSSFEKTTRRWRWCYQQPLPLDVNGDSCLHHIDSKLDSSVSCDSVCGSLGASTSTGDGGEPGPAIFPKPIPDMRCARSGDVRGSSTLERAPARSCRRSCTSASSAFVRDCPFEEVTKRFTAADFSESE